MNNGIPSFSGIGDQVCPVSCPKLNAIKERLLKISGCQFQEANKERKTIRAYNDFKPMGIDLHSLKELEFVVLIIRSDPGVKSVIQVGCLNCDVLAVFP
jgi:hypothetical protein